MKSMVHAIGKTTLILTLISTLHPVFTMTDDYVRADSADVYTHTVFVEVGTAQWCGPCHYWNANIHSTHDSGLYDFEYVEMIMSDHSGNVLNGKAYSRMMGYGLGAYPTSYFDGGTSSIVGNYPDQLPSHLNSAGGRVVADVDATLDLIWLGPGTLAIDITVQNNETADYDAHVMTFIYEPVSRYTTAYGSQYYNGFLDWADNLHVVIGPGESYTNTTIWVGGDHGDSHGDDFGDITIDNIEVALVVFDDATEYVDDAVVSGVTGENYRPTVPAAPAGENVVNVGAQGTYSATTTDPEGDQIYYLFDWGDGTDSGWLGPFASGGTAEATHAWDERGTYDVTVMAKDDFGETGSSDSLTVHVEFGHHGTLVESF